MPFNKVFTINKLYIYLYIRSFPFNVYDLLHRLELYSLSTKIENKCMFEIYSPFIYTNNVVLIYTKAQLNKMKH